MNSHCNAGVVQSKGKQQDGGFKLTYVSGFKFAVCSLKFPKENVKRIP